MKTAPATDADATFYLDGRLRYHSYDFIRPSPSGRFIACKMFAGAGDGSFRVYDSVGKKWLHLPPQEFSSWCWLPDESGLLIGKNGIDYTTTPFRFWFHLYRVDLNGRIRRLLQLEQADDCVYDWVLLPDASSVVLVNTYARHRPKTEDDPGETRTQVQLFELKSATLRPVWISPVSTGYFNYRNNWLSLHKQHDDWILAYHALGDTPTSYWINLRTGMEQDGIDATGAPYGFENNYAYSPNGSAVLASGKLRRSRNWPTAGKDVFTRQLADCALASPEASLFWSPDSRSLLISKWEASVNPDIIPTTIYDTDTGRKLYTLDNHAVPAYAWPVGWVGPRQILMGQHEATGDASQFFLVTPGKPLTHVTPDAVLFHFVWQQD